MLVRNVMDDVILPDYLKEQEEPGNGNGEPGENLVKEIRPNKLSALYELSGRYHLLSGRYFLQSELWAQRC